MTMCGDKLFRLRKKNSANQRQRAVECKERHWVLLKFNKARLKSKVGNKMVYVKLALTYNGPIQILENIDDVSFTLHLPSHWKIHNAFHVSL